MGKGWKQGGAAGVGGGGEGGEGPPNWLFGLFRGLGKPGKNPKFKFVQF